MNIIANNVVAKLTVAFVAAAMLFALATPAKAATVEELQAQIAALMEQIAALSGDDVMAPAAGCTFTRSLSDGSEGADVTCLQDYLTSTGHFNFAGGSTGYFGPVTTAAVAAWQASNGVAPAVGYFGPVSQAKYSELMAVMPPVDDDDDEDMDDDDVTLQGEADLQTFEVDDAEEDEVEEGADDVVVAQFTVEFDDGDAEISRIDVSFDPAPVGTDPWDVLENVSLWLDGDKIAEEDADDEDEYQDEDTGTIRFGGLDLVGLEDEDFELEVAATIQNNVDTTDQGNVTVTAESVRFFDADGVATTEDATDDLGGPGTAVFTIEEAGADDELIVKTSTDDPSGTTLQVEDDSDSDWYTVFIFDIDTDDSENDIELNSIEVDVTVSSSTYNAIVDDAEIEIDGVNVNDVTVANGGTGTATLTFDVDGDVVIDAGERVAAEVMLQFNSLAAGDEGTTVLTEVTAANRAAIDAEGADDLTAGQLSGAATGDAHTLRTKGVDVELDDAQASVTTGDNALDDYGTYTISIDVTAFEQDVYIDVDPANSFAYLLEDGASSSSVPGTRSVTLTSTGSEVGSTFEITEGATETLTLEVTYTPGVASTPARLQLVDFDFGETSGAPTGQTWTASPEEDYRTSVVTMVN
jgi:peptidoglycan hydrolase-like protein with peptidoglycan-binding domain